MVNGERNGIGNVHCAEDCDGIRNSCAIISGIYVGHQNFAVGRVQGGVKGKVAAKRMG